MWVRPSGPACTVLRWCRRRVGGLGPGLTCESADALSGCPANDSPAGSQVIWQLPAVPSRSARPVQEAGVHRPGGQRVRATPSTRGMAMTIVEDKRAITGGVDTHAGMHVGAALDPIGGLLGVQEFPATAAGYAGCWAGWAGSGPSPWPASKARAVTARAWPATSPRPASGSSRPAAPTARTAAGRASPTRWMPSAPPGPPAGRARGAPKGRDGAVEAIRALMADRRSARSERVQTNGQARALVLTGPDDLRARSARHTAAGLVSGLASLRPRPGDVAGYATRIAVRELGRRAGVPRRPARAPRRAHRPARRRSCPRPARPARCRPRHRRPAPGRRRGPPGAAAQRGRLGAPVRGRPDPGIVGESHPPAPQPRRRPPGQPRPMADRAHPDQRPSADAHLRRAARPRKACPRKRSSGA